MPLPHRSDAGGIEMLGIVQENARRTFARFWRESARLITLFEEASPARILCGEHRRNC